MAENVNVSPLRVPEIMVGRVGRVGHDHRDHHPAYEWDVVLLQERHTFVFLFVHVLVLGVFLLLLVVVCTPYTAVSGCMHGGAGHDRLAALISTRCPSAAAIHGALRHHLVATTNMCASTSAQDLTKTRLCFLALFVVGSFKLCVFSPFYL